MVAPQTLTSLDRRRGLARTSAQGSLRRLAGSLRMRAGRRAPRDGAAHSDAAYVDRLYRQLERVEHETCDCV